jgi:hypothetical protein
MRRWRCALIEPIHADSPDSDVIWVTIRAARRPPTWDPSGDWVAQSHLEATRWSDATDARSGAADFERGDSEVQRRTAAHDRMFYRCSMRRAVNPSPPGSSVTAGAVHRFRLR